jgi:hypothetical protein
MNTQLKGKMQKAYCEYCNSSGGNCGHIDRDDKFYLECESEGKDDFLAGASAMYSALKDQIEWVSVEERMPERHKEVLLKDSGEKYSLGSFNGRFIKAQYSIGFNVLEVTHWRRIEL